MIVDDFETYLALYLNKELEQVIHDNRKIEGIAVRQIDENENEYPGIVAKGAYLIDISNTKVQAAGITSKMNKALRKLVLEDDYILAGSLASKEINPEAQPKISSYSVIWEFSYYVEDEYEFKGGDSS